MTDHPPGTSGVRGTVLTGIVGTFAVAAALAWTGTAPLDALAAAALLVLLPALSVAQARVLGAVEIERVPAYLSSIVSLTLLGAAAVLLGSRSGGARGLGFVPLPAAAMAAWTAGLVASGLALLVLFRAVCRRAGWRESPIVRGLLPRTRRERGIFVILSGAAGLGEETAYRGYLFATLAPGIGAGGAAVLTSAVFGVLHAYQGPPGMVRAGLLGGLLAVGLLGSGSLWPPIVAHAVLDALAGLVLGRWLIDDGGSP
ncbi:MAG TPA: CPBP family intramembrane glutamic endopeptidase [Longimicrobiales bacterium]|nr:CPBP family intramembrane glutamic endopeptidase [Longimicrobiales bacterium]